ncbi:hypothetical protein RF11_02352 [Thelohanellus kitauei]|uniref:Uncharacterized protein n=1 Tax=Thelohanellus kitauei TaxID=669202 RepID=A0A0C2J6E1_THEKT|nr:hypothetical protein RF11_02352 [Thelohanellus kitauei]
MVTEGKNSKKVAVTAAKTKALGQKRFLALSIMRLLLEDWKDDEGDLRVVLEHLITFEFVPIDAVSKAIAKFVNMYTLALVEDYDHLQFSDKIGIPLIYNFYMVPKYFQPFSAADLF